MTLTQQDVIAFTTGLPEVVAVTASQATGSPEVAWGDTFFFRVAAGVDPLAARAMPFATIVTKDYPGFDTASDLNRPGTFRVNAAVGRVVFEQLVGYPPAAHTEHVGDWDHTVADRLTPHPVYAAQGWVSVVNPGLTSADALREAIRTAHRRTRT
jgi:hypothetical protein